MYMNTGGTVCLRRLWCVRTLFFWSTVVACLRRVVIHHFVGVFNKLATWDADDDDDDDDGKDSDGSDFSCNSHDSHHSHDSDGDGDASWLYGFSQVETTNIHQLVIVSGPWGRRRWWGLDCRLTARQSWWGSSENEAPIVRMDSYHDPHWNTKCRVVWYCMPCMPHGQTNPMPHWTLCRMS